MRQKIAVKTMNKEEAERLRPLMIAYYPEAKLHIAFNSSSKDSLYYISDNFNYISMTFNIDYLKGYKIMNISEFETFVNDFIAGRNIEPESITNESFLIY